MIDVAVIMGTRPEIIKLAPVLTALQESSVFRPMVIATGQHETLAEQAFRTFNIFPDFDLGLMSKNQSPQRLLAELLLALDPVLGDLNPRGVVVQGDTTSAFGGALGAFHLNLPVAHVEAGLRTFDFGSPFPEEMNRVLISKISTFHFAPTELSAKNLSDEGIINNVHIVGNTVVDAVEWIATELAEDRLAVADEVLAITSKAQKILFVTGHRRENFDEPLRNLCAVLERLVREIPDLSVVFPVHPNPNVNDMVKQLLSHKDRIHLLNPIDYPSTIFLMKRCQLIMTDSGGIQEEAPTFGRKVLVTRKLTERPEAINAGIAELVDLREPDDVFRVALTALLSPQRHGAKPNPFGDGLAAKRIVAELERVWS